MRFVRIPQSLINIVLDTEETHISRSLQLAEEIGSR